MSDNCSLVDCFDLFTQQETLDGDDRPVSKCLLISVYLLSSCCKRKSRLIPNLRGAGRDGFVIRQKSFVGRALPGPAGGAYSAPPYPIAASWGKGREKRDGRAGGGGKARGGRGREKEEGRKWEEEDTAHQWVQAQCTKVHCAWTH